MATTGENRNDRLCRGKNLDFAQLLLSVIFGWSQKAATFIFRHFANWNDAKKAEE
jgi:hypothetical protein